MKSTFLPIALSFIFLILYTQTFAQRFRGGISAGLVTTDVGGDDPRDYDNDFHKAGFVFGGFVTTPINEKSSLQFELNVIQKGTLQSADSNGIGYYKLALDYLEIPVIFKRRLNLNFSKRKVNGFDIQAGVSVGKIFQSTIEGDNIAQNPDMGFLKKTDLSILMGIDYEFSDHFNFCLRYSNSVIRVFKNDYFPIGSYYNPLGPFNNGNNLVFHFIFQYTFGIAKNIVG